MPASCAILDKLLNIALARVVDENGPQARNLKMLNHPFFCFRRSKNAEQKRTIPD